MHLTGCMHAGWQVGEKDQIFGSVSAADIVEAIELQTGRQLDKKVTSTALFGPPEKFSPVGTASQRNSGGMTEAVGVERRTSVFPLTPLLAAPTVLTCCAFGG